MTPTFKDCLANKRIFVFAAAAHLTPDELKDAEDDLTSAKEDLSHGGNKWATVKGYYAMFHAARTLLYSKGYRERGHYCLYLAMKELFVKENLLANKLAEDFYHAMILREGADYKRNFSAESAAATIASAEKFISAAKNILKK
jgi:uncharacterized protein (UPF0332 family)